MGSSPFPDEILISSILCRLGLAAGSQSHGEFVRTMVMICLQDISFFFFSSMPPHPRYLAFFPLSLYIFS